MQQLGIPLFIADRIIKYRNAGGKFNKPEDLTKIYGFDQKLFDDLESYISINVVKEGSFNNGLLKEKIVLAGPSIDLNKADSVQLLKVKGIGPVFASRIMRYRKSLGGFYNIHQLNEVYGITDSSYSSLTKSLFVDSTLKLEEIRINKVEFKELNKHPYFRNFNLIRSMLNYRDQHGEFHSLNDMKSIILINDSILNRIAPYVSFE